MKGMKISKTLKGTVVTKDKNTGRIEVTRGTDEDQRDSNVSTVIIN